MSGLVKEEPLYNYELKIRIKTDWTSDIEVKKQFSLDD